MFVFGLLGIGLPILAAKPVEVTVWGLAITPDEKGNDELVRTFERANPGIKIKLLGMGAGAMNPQKLMTSIVGGAPPDMVRQDRFTINDWASRGAFMPLNPLLERDRNDPDCPRAKEYYSAAWGEAQYQGQQYGIPTAADDRVLYWNRKVFREAAPKLRAAGLDPDRPPRTWSETLAYSKALTEFHPDGTIKRAGFIPNSGNAWLYLYAFQNNASFMSGDGRTCTLNSPEAVGALEFMKACYQVLGGYENSLKFQSAFRSGANDPLAAGQVAMIITGDWYIPQLARYAPKTEFSTAPAPVPDDRYYRRGRFANEQSQFVTWSGGFSWVIPKGAKHAEEAWKFIKWITSFEGRSTYTKAQAAMERSRGRRFIPQMEAHRPSNEWVLKNYASGSSPYEQAWRTHFEMMSHARMRPATFAGQKLWDAHVFATEQACRGIMSPAEALQMGQQQVQSVLDEYNLRDRYPTVDIRVPVGAAFLCAFLGLVGWILSMLKRGRDRVSREETRAGYGFIAPWLIGFTIFTLGPMTASLVFSVMQYDVLNPAHFVGTKNFSSLFIEDRNLVMSAFSNVGYLAVVGIPLGLATGLSIGLLLNAAARGIRFYRTAYYLPAICPSVAGVFLWMWILTPDNQRGLLNNVWQKTITVVFAVPPPGWFTVEPWAKPALVLMGLWGAGGGMILWLAGLKGIPQSLYEAAEIDGADGWRSFFSITLPQLSPLIFFNSVIAFIAVLQTFDSVYLATKGESMGPNNSLATPVYVLFTNGFAYFRMGYASALAWVIFLIVLLVTLLQFRVARHWVYYEVDR